MNRRNFLTPLGLLLIAAFPQWTRSRITPSSRMWLHESSSDLQRVWKLRGGLCRGICSQMSPALLGGTEGHGWGRGVWLQAPGLFCSAWMTSVGHNFCQFSIPYVAMGYTPCAQWGGGSSWDHPTKKHCFSSGEELHWLLCPLRSCPLEMQSSFKGTARSNPSNWTLLP